MEYTVERQNVTHHSKGTLVLIKQGLDFEQKSVLCDPNGRFIILEAVVQDTPVLLVNIYAPNKTHEPNDRLPNDKKC